MPVRPLSDRILVWPSAEEVHAAASAWADTLGADRPDIRAIGYFGSYARGDWGVGSDLDVVVVFDDDVLTPTATDQDRSALSLTIDLPRLPVPVDLLAYTWRDWKAVAKAGMQRPAEEMIWIYSRN